MESSNILIVLGMHRSGASLLARWLHGNGISMGDNMIGASLGNKHGHFESKKILQLHVKVLRELELDFRVNKSIADEIPSYFEYLQP